MQVLSRHLFERETQKGWFWDWMGGGGCNDRVLAGGSKWNEVNWEVSLMPCRLTLHINQRYPPMTKSLHLITALSHFMSLLHWNNYLKILKLSCYEKRMKITRRWQKWCRFYFNFTNDYYLLTSYLLHFIYRALYNCTCRPNAVQSRNTH